jgi:hypothetical protein
MVAYSGEVTVELPATEITIMDSDDEQLTPSQRAVPLAEAIETLCFDYLWAEFEGWEVNDGSFGTFTFAVADCSIDLDFTQRVMDEENSKQRF